MLADLELGQVEAEARDPPLEVEQRVVRQAIAAVAAQARLHQRQVGTELVGARVGASFAGLGALQAGGDQAELASVRFVTPLADGLKPEQVAVALDRGQ